MEIDVSLYEIIFNVIIEKVLTKTLLRKIRYIEKFAL